MKPTIGFTAIILLVSIGLLCACFVAFGALAEAQPARVYRLGVLVVGGADIPQVMGLRDGLKNHGYIQGENLDLEIAAKANYDEYGPLVKTYKEKKADVLVTIGGTVTRVVKDFAPEIPTVFSFGSDPVQAGFVNSTTQQYNLASKVDNLRTSLSNTDYAKGKARSVSSTHGVRESFTIVQY